MKFGAVSAHRDQLAFGQRVEAGPSPHEAVDDLCQAQDSKGREDVASGMSTRPSKSSV